MRTICAIIIAVLFAPTSKAQTLEKFTYLGEIYGANELYIGVNPTYSMVRNKAVPFAKNHELNGISGDFSLRKVNFQQGKVSWNWQNKMYGDLLLLLNKALTKTSANDLNRKEGTSMTSGVIGWLDFTWAMNKPNGRFQWSLGANLNDYFYGSTIKLDSLPGENWATYDPQGYFLAAGPTVKMNYLLGNSFMLEFSGSYSISYWKALDVEYATNPDPDYPLPHWGQIDLELQSKWGVFTGVNYNWIINRGNIPSAGKRLDLILGFRFMI